MACLASRLFLLLLAFSYLVRAVRRAVRLFYCFGWNYSEETNGSMEGLDWMSRHEDIHEFFSQHMHALWWQQHVREWSLVLVLVVFLPWGGGLAGRIFSVKKVRGHHILRLTLFRGLTVKATVSSPGQRRSGHRQRLACCIFFLLFFCFLFCAARTRTGRLATHTDSPCATPAFTV